MRRPRVALTLCGHDAPRCRIARDQYTGALERAGGVVIPWDPGEVPPADFDALCLSGGGDIDPARYGAPNAGSHDIDPVRDATEFALAERALREDIPILGICRGFQVLNVALGGTLVQHLDGHDQRLPGLVPHVAVAEPGSRLAGVCGTDPQTVNSAHHQAVTPATLASALRPTVLIGGSVEAFESSEHRFLLAVQWHPERTAEVHACATRIFRGLVAAASERPAAAASERA